MLDWKPRLYFNTPVDFADWRSQYRYFFRRSWELVRAYFFRVLRAGGRVQEKDTTRRVIEGLTKLGLMDGIRLLFVSGGGLMIREDGVNGFVEIGYDLGPEGNDATQTTALLQLFLSGNIAPAESIAVKEPQGDTRRLSITPITFTGTVAVVNDADAVGKRVVVLQDYAAATITSIDVEAGRSYIFAVFGETLSAALKTAVQELFESIYPEIPSVVIGTQQWATSNLEMVATPLGNVIANVTDNATWASATTLYDNAYAAHVGTVSEKEYAGLKAAAMWCYYNNDPTIGAVYGKLYNWYAAKLLDLDMASTGYGWRVPTQTDFETLYTALGGQSVAGGKMKVDGTDYWNSPNAGADNNCGFSALPGGSRISTGSFSLLNTYYFVWASTSGFRVYLFTDDTKFIIQSAIPLNAGYSIRLIKE